MNEKSVSKTHKATNSQTKIAILFPVGDKNIKTNINEHGIDAIMNQVNLFPLCLINVMDLSDICPAIGSFIIFQSPYIEIAIVINMMGKKTSVS
ncbi:hypothetical protein ES705_49746 [subsurface metagenome]